MTARGYVFQPRPPIQPALYQATEFDGKRLRKAIARKTVDYNSSIVKMLETRIWCKDYKERHAIQPDTGYYPHLTPPMAMIENPVNCVTTKFVRTSTNKMRCPIFCVLWTPEGRRLVTGASSGEFTLWNGLTFNFETILQAHETAVRVMVWSKNDTWMVTGDQKGYVKYWQSNMNNVKMFRAHLEPIRGISMCPTDTKFATCSDDGTLQTWDFFTCNPEQTLRGHGSDVKCVDWHPTKSLIVSGSKDAQQPIKLWDPKSGQNLATLHAHKSTVMDVKWNKNGNWLLTASRDHLIKIFDIRNISQEMQVFRGHKKEACCLAWHPVHESLFASGGSDGSILFWLVGTEKEVGGMDNAHDSVVWSLSWHPLGHILASGSNDHSCKFWTRNRPGDKMGDKYNLNIEKRGPEETDYEELDTIPTIPGITRNENEQIQPEEDTSQNRAIPGLGSTTENTSENRNEEDGPPQQKKVPFSKPVPKQFETQWQDRSHPVINPDNDRHFDRHMNSTSSHPPPYGHQPPHSNHYPPPPQTIDHHMNDVPYGGPMMGPPHGPGGPPPPMPPPHMRRDDDFYDGRPPSDRFDYNGPDHRFGPPNDRFHPPHPPHPPIGPYDDGPPDFPRRDPRWRGDDDFMRRDEDFRRHNFDHGPRPSGPRDWRGPPPGPPGPLGPPGPPDDFHWRGGPNERWRRGDPRWEWDRRDHPR